MTTVNLIDTHVHFYPCFEATRFLNAACDNFQREIKHSRLPKDTLCHLCLTEKSEHHFFETLRSEDWKDYQTKEKYTRVVKKGEHSIHIIAGRQIVTKEQIEILAIGTLSQFKEGASLQDTLHAIEQAEAIAIIPWGFGKWWGKRGEIIKKLIQSNNAPKFLLGDNGGRLHIGVKPPIFKQGSARGIPIVPGSDPLPFKSQECHAGRCGVIVEGKGNILDLLGQLETSTRTYGNGEHLLPFIINQTTIQVRKCFA